MKIDYRQLFLHLFVTAAGVAASAYLNKKSGVPGAPAVTAGNLGVEVLSAELPTLLSDLGGAK